MLILAFSQHLCLQVQSATYLDPPTQANHTLKTRALLLLGRCECRWPPSWLRSSKKVSESVFQHTVRCGSLRHKSLSPKIEGSRQQSSQEFKGCLDGLSALTNLKPSLGIMNSCQHAVNAQNPKLKTHAYM